MNLACYKNWEWLDQVKKFTYQVYMNLNNVNIDEKTYLWVL